MIKVRDIIDVIEGFAPSAVQESWDNCGLCIGSEEAQVDSVLLGLDCTPALVDEAIAMGANMIVTHHPLIFKGLKKISGNDPVTEAVVKAIKNDIAIYAAHTSADKVFGGVSWAMAGRMGLADVEVLEQDSPGVGLGVVGNLPSPMPVSEFTAFVKERFGLDHVRISRTADMMVSRVAMCGGSGGSLIAKAKESGAQAYISGDISYHEFFVPEGFMIMDIGHYESEKYIVEILFSLIRKKFPNFAVRMSENAYSNPVLYI